MSHTSGPSQPWDQTLKNEQKQHNDACWGETTSSATSASNIAMFDIGREPKDARVHCSILDFKSHSRLICWARAVSRRINWLRCDLQALFPLAFWLHRAVKVGKIH